MSFILEIDYLPYIKQQSLDQLKANLNNSNLLEDINHTAIAEVKDALHDRFDTGAIFGSSGSNRPPQVLRWCIVKGLYYLYHRTADINIPARILEDYTEVLEILGDIAKGKRSVDLPRLLNVKQQPISKIRWGSDELRQHHL